MATVRVARTAIAFQVVRVARVTRPRRLRIRRAGTALTRVGGCTSGSGLTGRRTTQVCWPRTGRVFTASFSMRWLWKGWLLVAFDPRARAALWVFSLNTGHDPRCPTACEPTRHAPTSHPTRADASADLAPNTPWRAIACNAC